MQFLTRLHLLLGSHHALFFGPFHAGIILTNGANKDEIPQQGAVRLFVARIERCCETLHQIRDASGAPEVLLREGLLCQDVLYPLSS